MSYTPLDSVETDFSEQLEILAKQAALELEDRAPKAEVAALTLSETLRPLQLGIAALGRAVLQNATTLDRLEKTQASVPDAMKEMQTVVTQKNATTQKLFDAMHDELRTYKDGLLFEIFQKPIARDLIALYDDLSRVDKQTDAFLTDFSSRLDLKENEMPVLQQLRVISTNLSHGLLSLIETMARMELVPVPPHVGKIDRQGQKVVAIEPAAVPEDDGMIARSVKPGFQWRGRSVRPEEVVVKRWSGGTGDADSHK